MGRPSLAVWGGGSLRALRARQREGAEVVAWPGAEPQSLAAAGVPFRTLEDVLGPDGLAATEAAGRAWARVWARLPLVEGRSFRDLVEWRGESLLWTAEGFLRTATAGPRCARTAELCLRLLETLQPSELDAWGLAIPDQVLLSRAATASGVLFHGDPGSAKPLATVEPPPAQGALRRVFRGFLPRRSAQLDPAPGPQEAPLLVFVVAREEDRATLAPLAESARQDGSNRTAILAVDTLDQFETRRSRRAVAEGERRLRERLATLRGTPALAASYAHRGIGFADLAASDLAAVLLGRLPVVLRTLERAVEVLASARPALVVVAITDRDERRTLGLAAAAAGAPWATLRVGADPEDEPERADAGPHPLAVIAPLPGEDLGAVLPRLREAAHDRVSPP